MNDEKFLDLEEQDLPGEESVSDDGKLSESELLSAIQDEISSASQYSDLGEIAEDLDYYDALLPEPREDETENEYNDYVSADVRNAIESSLAEILPGFYGDMPVSFIPMGPGDEQNALNESTIINHVFMTSNKGYTVLNRAFKDALTTGDALVKVWWDDRTEVNIDRIEGVPPEILFQMQMELGDSLSGAEQNDDGTYTVEVKVEVKNGKPIIEWVPKEDVLVNHDHSDTYLDSARFVCHRRAVPRSDLVAFGMSKEDADEVPAASGTYKESMSSGTNIDNETGHKSTEPVMVAESYYMIDADADGIAERRRVITAGGRDGDQKFIREEPWNDQPFAHGVAFYPPRGWEGISMTDRIKEIQDVKSDMMRQILDAGWRNLQQRVGAVERLVNISDLLSSKRGGVVRLKDPGALVPLPDVVLPHQAFSLLDSLDKTRRESGAGSIDSAPQAQEMGADSAHGIERIMSAVEESNAMVAKNLAETLVVGIYLKVHKLLKKWWPGPIFTKNEQQWLRQIPAEWLDRNDAAVAVGLSTGTRMRQAQNVAAVILQQSTDMAAGLTGVLTGAKQMYAARTDYSRLMGIRYPEKYWLDPESPEAQQAQQMKQQQEQEAAQKEKEALDLQYNTLKEIEVIRAQSSKMDAEIKAQSDQYKSELAHIEKTMDQRLKLIELNAAYDEDPVPGDNSSGAEGV